MTVNLGKVVVDSPDYELVVTEGVDGTGEYSLISKEFGVTEAATPMLPQALEYLDQLQAALSKRGEEAEAKEKVIIEADNVTSIH